MTKLARFLLPSQVAALKEAHRLTDEAMARYGITPEKAGRKFREQRRLEVEAIERAERLSSSARGDDTGARSGSAD